MNQSLYTMLSMEVYYTYGVPRPWSSSSLSLSHTHIHTLTHLYPILILYPLLIRPPDTPTTGTCTRSLVGTAVIRVSEMRQVKPHLQTEPDTDCASSVDRIRNPRPDQRAIWMEVVWSSLYDKC